MALSVGIAALADGFLRDMRAILVVGCATAGVALVIQVVRAAAHYAWSTWGALAVLGVAVIVLAALIERHHGSLRGRAAALRTRVASWEY